MVQLSGRQKGESAVEEPPTTVKQENLEDGGEEGAERDDAPSRVNAPTTYSVSLAKKGMRVISNGVEIKGIKGIPSSGLVPRKSVNPPDKTSSAIDRREGSMVGCEIIFKLSLVEPVGKERIMRSIFGVACERNYTKPQMRPSK